MRYSVTSATLATFINSKEPTKIHLNPERKYLNEKDLDKMKKIPE